jgi:Zn-dependent membrane protease YugP
MFYDSSYLLWVMLPTALLSMWAQWRVKSAYNKYSKVPNERGLTGLETAQLLMRHQGLEHVEIERIPGMLTDHYDPRSKTMRLSQGSIDKPSVAAMAIVAHELGHAEQDKTGNAMLNLRAALVPAANLGSNLGIWLVIGGVFLSSRAGSLGMGLAWLGILLFSAAVAFTLVTLPVEFDASRRAKKHLYDAGLVSPTEQRGVSAVLDAAALTYVAAAAAAVINLLYWINVVSGRSRS